MCFLSSYVVLVVWILLSNLDTGTGKKRHKVTKQKGMERKGIRFCLEFIYLLGKTVSAFKSKNKITPLKKLVKYPKFHSPFSKLSEEWIVLDNVTNFLEEFV